MKNIWKILAAMIIVALPFAVASCGGDDEEDVSVSISALVGTWIRVDGNSAYIVFTKTTLTIHDRSDMMSGKAISYSCKGNTIYVGGYPLYTIKKLTKTTLVLLVSLYDGQYTEEITLVKQDEPYQIPTLTYVWELKNVNIDKVPEVQQATVINARTQINKMIASAYRSATVKTPESRNAHFTVTEDAKEFSLQTNKRAEDIDDEVLAIFLNLKTHQAFMAQASILNDNKIEAKLVITRGNKSVVDKSVY